MTSLPSICSELGVRQESGVPVVNSRDVARLFEKRHGDVLEAIDRIIHDGNLRHVHNQWFKETFASHATVAGRLDRSFDMTRDGFTLLVMGYTGARAMQFKVQYIQAFNAMEDALKSGGGDDRFLAAVREIVAPLAVRFAGQDQAIERIEGTLTQHGEKLDFLARHIVAGKRRNLTLDTKREHVFALIELGGKCPCCGIASVIDNGARAPFAEFDHFYQSSHPNAEHTWLICKPCHNDLTTGKVARDQRTVEFNAYQSKRRRLPGRQRSLFG